MTGRETSPGTGRRTHGQHRPASVGLACGQPRIAGATCTYICWRCSDFWPERRPLSWPRDHLTTWGRAARNMYGHLFRQVDDLLLPPRRRRRRPVGRLPRRRWSGVRHRPPPAWLVRVLRTARPARPAHAAGQPIHLILDPVKLPPLARTTDLVGPPSGADLRLPPAGLLQAGKQRTRVVRPSCPYNPRFCASTCTYMYPSRYGVVRTRCRPAALYDGAAPRHRGSEFGAGRCPSRNDLYIRAVRG